jgi:hypothetical protein
MAASAAAAASCRRESPRRGPTLWSVSRTSTRHSRRPARALALAALAVTLAAGPLAGCTLAGPRAGTAAAHPKGGAPAHSAAAGRGRPGTGLAGNGAAGNGTALPPPAALALPGGPAFRGEGTWRPVGRRVHGAPAVYEAEVIPPGGSQRAGIAWMDTRLLAARLYSGSESPGGTGWHYSAPVASAQAVTLVAAFNGGFQMKDARGGYFAEGRNPYPLARGAASLVFYASGAVTVGTWGTDVRQVRGVVAVRQNLTLLVSGGRPTAAARGDWHHWGNTCGVTSCAAWVPEVEHQWRSGVGVTASGALVYALGPGLAPLQLAWLLARAGALRGMELDINPEWPVFAAYGPAAAAGRATPVNGRKLLATVQGPGTFFERQWARDFITMSAR